MKPLLLLLLLGGGGLLFASSSSAAPAGGGASGGGSSGSGSSGGTPPFIPPSAGGGKEPPDSVLKAVTDALASANPARMRAVAAELRKQGWTLQAAGLEEAARLTELAQQTGTSPPPVTTPPVTPTVPGGGSVPPIVLPPIPLPPGMPPVVLPPVTLPPATVPKVRLLKSGLQGADVAAWQLVLAGDGYDLGPTGSDGKFGPKTVAATKAWQAARGLKADGIVGPNTLAKIGTKPNTPALPAARPKIDPSKWRTLRQGTAGKDVAEWQQVLISDGYSVGATGADGKFGPNTTKATKAWQAARGLTADGVVGAGTRGKINQGTTTFAGEPALALELLPSTPLPGIVPYMDPTQAVDPRRALAARTCVMLYNSRPGSEDKALVTEFQELTGAKPTGLYTAGTAVMFIQFGLVPPMPFYWAKKGVARSKLNYRNVLLAKAASDPARHDEWAAAAMFR